MQGIEFLAKVAERSDLARAECEQATEATLRTLAERISPGEADDVAGQLPSDLAPFMETTSGAQQFGLDEFLRRVAEREGVTPDEAHGHARAVLASLRETIGGEFEHVWTQLPDEYTAVIGRY